MRNYSGTLIAWFPVIAVTVPILGAPYVAGQGKEQIIPLAKIYTTSGPKGTQRLEPGEKKTVEKRLRTLLERNPGNGASNVFLVTGDDISTALSGTLKVFVGGQPADVPADDSEGKERKYWVVAYFGYGAARWMIQAVTREGETFRVSFVKRKPLEASSVEQYFAWVPVGQLEPGLYDLELFDAENKEITLIRKVRVNNK